MVDETEKNLKENIKEYISSGDEETAKGRFNSAVNAYYKALAVLCDLKIYEKTRVLPKNHSERFLFLKMHFEEAYKILNPLFNKYTDSYNLRLNKKDVLIFKENVEKLKRIFNFA